MPLIECLNSYPCIEILVNFFCLLGKTFCFGLAIKTLHPQI